MKPRSSILWTGSATVLTEEAGPQPPGPPPLFNLPWRPMGAGKETCDHLHPYPGKSAGMELLITRKKKVRTKQYPCQLAATFPPPEASIIKVDLRDKGRGRREQRVSYNRRKKAESPLLLVRQCLDIQIRLPFLYMIQNKSFLLVSRLLPVKTLRQLVQGSTCHSQRNFGARLDQDILLKYLGT